MVIRPGATLIAGAALRVLLFLARSTALASDEFQGLISDVELHPLVAKAGVESMTFSVQVSDPTVVELELLRDEFSSYCLLQPTDHQPGRGLFHSHVLTQLPHGMTSLILRDDGLNGDAAAGDRLFSISGIQLALNTLAHPDLRAYWRQMGTAETWNNGREIPVRVRRASGEEFETTLHIDTPCGVIAGDMSVPEIETLSANLRRTSHLIIMTQPSGVAYPYYADDQSTSGIRFPHHIIAAELNELGLLDEYDFVFIQEFSGKSNQFWPKNRVIPGVYENLFSLAPLFPEHVKGYLYDQSAWMPGSLSPPFGGNFHTTIHELLHGWASFLPAEVGLSDSGGHYNFMSAPSSCFDGNGVNSWGDISFDPGAGKARIFWPPSGREPACNDVELYLMGLMPGAEVSPVTVAMNTRNLEYLSDYIEADSDGLKSVGVPEIVSAVGPRQPLPTFPKPSFRVVQVVIHDRPLTDSEISLFHHRAVETERTRSQFGFTFEEAVGDRANLITRIQMDTNGDSRPDAVGTDSDGDGLSDAEENSIPGLNANAIDTDSDGISDLDELLVYASNPLNDDTDGDGATDGEEVDAGSDPLLATSVPELVPSSMITPAMLQAARCTRDPSLPNCPGA